MGRVVQKSRSEACRPNKLSSLLLKSTICVAPLFTAAFVVQMDHPAKSQSRSPSAASVPLNEPRPPLPDWSWRGRAWPIYFREARGSHEAARRGWPAGLAASAHSWGWAVSEASCLSGLGYGYNESRLGDGDGVAAGGGAKPSPASGVREEHQLY